MDLPDEILLKVFSYLETDEVTLICRSVCRQWKNIAEDSSMWRELRIIPDFNPRMTEAILKLPFIQSAVVTLKLTEYKEISDDQLFKFSCNQTYLDLASLPNLQHLHVCQHQLDKKAVRYLTKEFPSLKVLHVATWEARDDLNELTADTQLEIRVGEWVESATVQTTISRLTLTTLLDDNPPLTELILSGRPIQLEGGGQITFSTLKTLELNDWTLYALPFIYAPVCTSLRASPVTRADGSWCVVTLPSCSPALSCPMLEDVSLPGCYLTIEFVEALSSTLTKVCFQDRPAAPAEDGWYNHVAEQLPLNASDFPYLKEVASLCPTITHLDLSFDPTFYIDLEDCLREDSFPIKVKEECNEFASGLADALHAFERLLVFKFRVSKESQYGSHEITRKFLREKLGPSTTYYSSSASFPIRHYCESQENDRRRLREEERESELIRRMEEEKEQERQRSRRPRPQPNTSVPCPICGKTFSSKAALKSHKRKH